MHAQSILRISWRDIESVHTISRSPWAFLGAGRVDIEKRFSTPVIVIGFISTLLREQVPVRLSEYWVLCDAHPGSTVPSIRPPTPALCP